MYDSKYNSSSENGFNDEKKTKFQQISNYMLLTFKDMYTSLRYIEFKFARSGIVISAILLVISSFFFMGPYLFSSNEITFVSFSIYPNLFGVFISFIIAFLEIYLWFLVGVKVTPVAAHYLVDNRILKLVFTKGNVHYIEFVPEEKRRIAMSHILSKFIALIIAWVSLSAFLLQLTSEIILSGDPTRILNPGNDLFDIFLFIIRTLVIFAFVPAVFTLVYPVGWMLIDAKLKAYNSYSKLNWFVGKKVINLTAGIITIGSIIGLGAATEVFEDPLSRLQLIIDLVLFCIINVSLIVTIIAIFYNIFFQGIFYERIVKSINIGYGITDVTLVNNAGEPIPKEKKLESTLEELSEDIESDQLESKVESIPDDESTNLMEGTVKLQSEEDVPLQTEEE
jgi:hypothetical protein